MAFRSTKIQCQLCGVWFKATRVYSHKDFTDKWQCPNCCCVQDFKDSKTKSRVDFRRRNYEQF